MIVLDPPRTEVIEAYKAADLFVFGSQVECSPLVLFEAAASSTPFVSLASGNAAEIAEWTGAGVIVPSIRRADRRVSSEAEGFAAEITRLCSDTDERRRLAERGRGSWLRQFTWDLIAPQYEEAYLTLVARRGGPPPRSR